jgi:hypothetical protein
MGEELEKIEKAKGGRPEKTGSSGGPVSPATLAELGLSKKQSSTYQALAAGTAEQFEAALEGLKDRGELSGAALVPGRDKGPNRRAPQGQDGALPHFRCSGWERELLRAI